MSEAVDRALMLIQQGRNDLAAPELQKHLATEPGDAFAHSLIAMCFSDQEKFTDATRHVEEAIKQAPDFAFAHYVAAYVLRDRNRFDEALPFVQESIRLDPYNSAAFGLLAQIHLMEKRHEEALKAAEQGLEVDAEDVHCQNLRAMALKNLGRHDAASDALKSALSKDPENSWTHANQGWALLEKNKREEALKHFQEALRLDPENDWAREGIVLSLKSRYRIYALMLKYFLWMGKLSGQKQWMVILGMFFLLRMLGQYSRSHPEHAMFVEPVRTLIIAFAIMTWIADPLFNLALRFSKYGRLALTRDQVNASSIVGILLAFSLLFIVLAYTVGPSGFYSMAALAFGVMIIPTSAIFNCSEGWPRRMMVLFTIALGLMAAVALGGLVAMSVLKIKSTLLAVLVVTCGIGFLVGILAIEFLANWLMGKQVRK